MTDTTDPTALAGAADEYTPTTQQVRTEWVESGCDAPTPRLHAGAAFDRWLAAHDHEVRVEYEKRRKSAPIHIDNIDGQNARLWLATHDAEVTARERRNIVAQVRRNCTIDWETVKKGGDALIYAVADWIENTPDWVPTYGDER